jgi:hypothetical protein
MAAHDSERSQANSEAQLKVTDRRLFTPDGLPRREAVEEREEPAPPGDTAAPSSSGTAPRRAAESGFEHRPVEEPDGVDFTMLINAMAEPALLFLGEIPLPGTGKAELDLERARIQIDMLDLLRVKCRGNLRREEEQLLDRILYQLRMLYVARANRPER